MSIAKAAKEKTVVIDWSMQPRQLAFLRACGLSYPLDNSGGPKEPAARVILYGGSAGGGKAIHILVRIPTPTGWTTMGEIKPGDIVFDDKGRQTQVLGVSDIMYDHKCYELEFSTGEKMIADEEHLWATMTDKDRTRALRLTDEQRAKRRIKRESRGKGKRPDLAERNSNRDYQYLEPHSATIKTTKEIYDTLLERGHRRNHSIAINGALDTVPTVLVVEPYVLGVWLGDGSSSNGSFASVDSEIVSEVEKQGYTCKLYSDQISCGVAGLVKQLKIIGVYKNKHIPKAYLRASVEQRLSLLQGLMDTDGYCDLRGQCEFTTINKELSCDVIELIRSLGIKATVCEGDATLNGRFISKKYRIKFITELPAFRLPRKLERQKRENFRGTHEKLYIVGCKPVESVPVKCIKVAAESGLFLAGESMIPTHNSDSLLIAGLIACITWPKCNVGYFRRKFPDLEGPGGAIMRSQDLYSELAKYHGGNHRWTFHEGGVLQFCHARNESDVYNYNSQQFDVLLIDESTQFSEYQIRYLLTRNRATVRNIVPFCAMATNPGGISHEYHLRKFVEIGPPETPVDVEVEKGRYQRHLFIPAKLEDNRVLEDRDPGYRNTLENMPEAIRRALLEGDWYVFEGQYFRNFSKEKHIVEPFELPSHWRRFGSIDWGFAAPCAVYLHAIDPTMGRVYTYKELYVTETRAADVAKMVKDMAGDAEIEYFKCSPDMWHERGLGSKAAPGEVIAEEFSKLGLNVEMADNRRILGWNRMREYLADAPDGKPWWQMFDNCLNLIRTLPMLVHDDRKPEDVHGDCEDHAGESCLTGDTLIDTAYGQMPIKNMVGGNYPVHCYDEQEEINRISICYDVRKTQEKAKVYEVALEDGRTVKVTKNHPVLTTDGWKEVGALKEGDDIVEVDATFRVQPSLPVKQYYDGLEFNRDKSTGYYLCTRTVNGKRERLHRYIWQKHNGDIPEGYHVHHVDGNKDNNVLHNYELMLGNKHISLHGQSLESKIRSREILLKYAHSAALKWHKSKEASEFYKRNWPSSLGKYLKIKVEKACEQCDAQYQVDHNHAKSGSRFCSNKCKSAYRREQGLDDQTRVCEVCGKEYNVNKYKKQVACGRACAGLLQSYTKTGVKRY